MAIGLIGKKRGMTRIFSDDGESTPVTVIEVISNTVVQVKTSESDGYEAIQVASGTKKASRLGKPEAGHFRKAGVEAAERLDEFRVENAQDHAIGDKLTVSLFEEGQLVDVTCTSKGKGFSGAVKRWNFSTQDATHGNSLSHRAPGSIGQCQTPGRVFKGKKMAGQYGNKRVTTQSLFVVKVDGGRNLLLVKGSVPGAAGNDVIIRPAAKARA